MYELAATLVVAAGKVFHEVRLFQRARLLRFASDELAPFHLQVVKVKKLQQHRAVTPLHIQRRPSLLFRTRPPSFPATMIAVAALFPNHPLRPIPAARLHRHAPTALTIVARAKSLSPPHPFVKTHAARETSLILIPPSALLKIQKMPRTLAVVPSHLTMSSPLRTTPSR